MTDNAEQRGSRRVVRSPHGKRPRARAIPWFLDQWVFVFLAGTLLTTLALGACCAAIPDSDFLAPTSPEMTAAARSQALNAFSWPVATQIALLCLVIVARARLHDRIRSPAPEARAVSRRQDRGELDVVD